MAGETLAFGDLIVGGMPTQGQPITVQVEPYVLTEGIAAYLEMYSNAEQTWNGTTVTLEVADDPDSPALTSAPVPMVTGRQPTWRVASAVIDAKSGSPAAKQVFDTAYGGGTNLALVLPHSRKNESEADRMGATYAARAGYDPRASITFWEKMVAQKKNAEKGGKASTGKIAGLLSTHPPDDQRIADLKALMPQVLPVYEQNRGRF